MKDNINNSNITSDINLSSKQSFFNDNLTEKKKENKDISISQTSTILDSAPEKYTLSKLINSVTNYRKESGNDFKIDVSTIKPYRLFHVDSMKTIGLGYRYNHRTSFIEKTKFRNISPLKKENHSVINTKIPNEEQVLDNTKKNLIDYFPVDKLIKMETKFIVLMSKIKNAKQLWEEYIIWLNDFKDSPFYEFQFIFKSVFDNESPIKENVINLIKNSTNIIIISFIISFWITGKYKNNNNIINNLDMKYVYELMIDNHKLYLLLCLFILIEADLITNSEDVYVLRLIEQIKAYLSKILRNFNNRLLVLNEMKSVTKKSINTINKIMQQNIFYSQELLDYANNLNKTEITILFEIFELIKNGNYVSNNNNYNNYDINTQNNQQYETQTNNTNGIYYKKIGKVNEHKNNLQINNGLYIRKSVANRPLNNKKITNKIINIIINNNNSNQNFEQNQNSNDYNINKKHNKFKRYSSNQNFNNLNNQQNSMTINYNTNINTDNYVNKFSNESINYLPQYKTINYNNMINTNLLNNQTNYVNYDIDPNYNNTFYNTNYLSFNQQIRIPQPDPPFLPPKQNKSEVSQKKFTLILDLDETLVRYKLNENNPDEAKVIFRPGLFYFLNKIYPLFDIVIWTIATREYADPIIDLIEENKKYFIARLFREHATIKNNNFIKDLTNLGRDIKTIIIIDDKESNFSFQKQNGILIKPFFGSYMELKNDFILYDLFKILTKIILDKSQDVRQGINKYQYEIKHKITKSSNKIITDNFNDNDNNNYLNNNSKTFVNNGVVNNNINNNINNNNYILKNNIINITQNYDNNTKINRSNSMSDSLALKKFSKKK